MMTIDGMAKATRRSRRRYRERSHTEWRVFWAITGVGLYMLVCGALDLAVNGWAQLFVTWGQAIASLAAVLFAGALLGIIGYKGLLKAADEDGRKG